MKVSEGYERTTYEKGTTMNMAFLFEVEYYPANGSKEQTATSKAVATGSQETRARRRLLDTMHKNGLYARKVTLLDSQPAPKGM